MSAPTDPRTDPAPDLEHAGARLGLPPTGPGSLAGLGRRVVALGIDWAACLAICVGLLGMAYPPAGAAAFWPTGVFFVESVLLVSTLGTTIGHRLLGMRVVRVDGRPVGLAAFVRTALLLLVIPAVIWDADGRGFHDRLAGTLLVRTS